jgi:hypothetical protein
MLRIQVLSQFIYRFFAPVATGQALTDMLPYQPVQVD